MSTTAEDKISEALQKEFESSNGAIQGAQGESELDFSDTPAEGEKPAATTEGEKPAGEAAKPEGESPEGEKKVEPVVEGEQKIVDSSLKQKSFEELLEEKTAGKYKSWDDIEKTISTPKEFKSKFAEKLEEYVAAGGDEETYYATQSINFDKMSTKELMEYKIQAEDPDMTQEEIDFEMKKRYGVDKWNDYEAGDEPEDVRIAKLRFEREANKARTQFKEHQAKWAVPPTKDNSSADASKIAADLEKWNNQAREAVSQLTKIPLKISDTETYDFTIDEAERNEIQKAVSQLRVDARDFWSSYKQEDGTYNLKGVAEAIFKGRNFDKAVALAVDQATKKGAKSIATELKNTSVNADPGKPDTTGGPKSYEQQLAGAFKESVTNK